MQASLQATQPSFEPGYRAAVELSEAPMVGFSLRLSFFSSGVVSVDESSHKMTGLHGVWPVRDGD